MKRSPSVILFNRFIVRTQWSTDGLWWTDLNDGTRETQLLNISLVDRTFDETTYRGYQFILWKFAITIGDAATYKSMSRQQGENMNKVKASLIFDWDLLKSEIQETASDFTIESMQMSSNLWISSSGIQFGRRVYFEVNINNGRDVPCSGEIEDIAYHTDTACDKKDLFIKLCNVFPCVYLNPFEPIPPESLKNLFHAGTIDRI